jgi:hypothetical protein
VALALKSPIISRCSDTGAAHVVSSPTCTVRVAADASSRCVEKTVMAAPFSATVARATDRCALSRCAAHASMRIRLRMRLP